MKINLISVKKDIIVHGITIVERGIYASEQLKEKLPFMDFGNTEYFEFSQSECIEPGTRVRFTGNGDCYYVINLIQVTSKRNSSNSIAEARYNISKSMTDRPKEYRTARESQLIVMNLYWFLDSKGIPQKGYSGENPDADNWRSKSRNMFETKEEAMMRRAEIMKYGPNQH